MLTLGTIENKEGDIERAREIFLQLDPTLKAITDASDNLRKILVKNGRVEIIYQTFSNNILIYLNTTLALSNPTLEYDVAWEYQRHFNKMKARLNAI